MRVLENAEKDLIKCLSEKNQLKSSSHFNSTLNTEDESKMREELRILKATQKTLYTTIARLRDQIASYSEYDRLQAEKQFNIVGKQLSNITSANNATSRNVTNIADKQ